ncbi:MAG: hypothetical protein AAGB04_30205, partial [Pseudomonadota bacterium]
ILEVPPPSEFEAMSKGFEFYEYDRGNEALISEIYSNRSYDLIEFITRHNWPEGFLIAAHSFSSAADFQDDCSGTGLEGSFSVDAIPRELGVFVAVLEPVHGSVTVESISVSVDDTIGLREDFDFRSTKYLEVGQEELNPDDGETLIVPLHVEFTYGEESGFSSTVDITDDIVARLDREQVSSDFRFASCAQEDGFLIGEDAADSLQACRIFAEDDLRSIASNVSEPVVPERYKYGIGYKLDSVTLSAGTTLNVRDAPEYALYQDAGYWFGSCPFIYLLFEDGSEVLYGRILVGAVGEENAKIDSIELPDGVIGIAIREIEPEISYIRRIDFVMNDGSKVRATSNLMLGPREGIKFSRPDGAASLEIAGYYELL